MLIAFPLQQRLPERSSILRHTYLACPIEMENQVQITA